MSTPKRPEILAPVATWEMCLAAVHNGADAIYVGMPHFNARGRTDDLSVEELRKIIDFCHLHGCKVFLAFNVLIFERELEQVEALLREIIPLGPDAFIVQDLGLVQLIKEMAPGQAVHASTQMTISSPEAIEITSSLGIERYVLAREVSLKEMSFIREKTDKELEVFVHGALCVSYSGQCLTSESHGGRSANRGQCAQSCRLPYELVVDGKVMDLGEKRHLVSPQDLCGLSDVQRLVELGIDSFKIEGRLKTAEYVASTVKNYKEVSNECCDKQPVQDLEKRLDQLSLTFARGRFNGWLDGVNHQRLVDARYSRPQGVFLGEVVKVTHDTIEVKTERLINPGDGIVLHDFTKDVELGGIVFSVRQMGPQILSMRLGDEFLYRDTKLGMQVFHNSSSYIEKQLRHSYTDKEQFKKIEVTATLSGRVGELLCFELSDNSGNAVQVFSESALQVARSAPLSKESAFEELGALSATAFYLTEFQFAVQGAGFIHNKVLKNLRRLAIEKLSACRAKVPVALRKNSTELLEWRKNKYRVPASASTSTAKLNVLIRDESQLEALQGLAIGTVYLDFEFNKDYEKALARGREMGFTVGIATTRILKPAELGHLKYIERLKPDCILVRNLGALQYFQNRGLTLVGDFSLNAANGLTTSWLLSKQLARICPSYDLNQSQLLDMMKAVSAQHFEITVHQYMPAFHMEHCVYAAFLSKGTSFKDCGKPCEKHRVELRDPDGVLHPLKPDAECRNTMFQGKPQSAARLIPTLLNEGVMQFRIEALFENVKDLRAKVEAYLSVINQLSKPEELFTRLGIVERYGVTEGQLFNDRVYQDKKKSLSVLQA